MIKTKRLAQCAVLIALALVLSYVDRMIPLQLAVPLPGVKLGLANIVTLLALYILGSGSAFIILIIRCLLGSFFGGSITSLLFSMTGGILAMCIMAAARRLRMLSIYGVSILGAAAHNIGQILAAMIMMHSPYVAAYLPYLLAVSLFTGAATGCACAGVLRVFSAADHGKLRI